MTSLISTIKTEKIIFCAPGSVKKSVITSTDYVVKNSTFLLYKVERELFFIFIAYNS